MRHERSDQRQRGGACVVKRTKLSDFGGPEPPRAPGGGIGAELGHCHEQGAVSMPRRHPDRARGDGACDTRRAARGSCARVARPSCHTRPARPREWRAWPSASTFGRGYGSAAFAPIVKLVTPRQRFPVRLPKATRALSPRTSTAQSHTKLEAATASWSLAWSR